MTTRPVATAIGASTSVVSAVVFGLWFRTGWFYAQGDVTPFIRNGLRSEFGWQWTHQASGAGGPTYELVRAPELVFIELARALGGSETIAQRLFFSAIFAFAAFGTALFIATFARRPWIVFAAGVIGAFNPFVMLGLANPLPPLTIGLVGCLGGVACRVAMGGRRRWVLLVALTIPLSYLVINPPLFAVVSAWTIALVVLAPLLVRSGRKGAARVLRFYAFSAIPALLVSLWWMVPSYFAFTSSARSGTMLAETDVRAWSWTQRNSSVGATATLTGKWSWPDPQFHAATWLAGSPWHFALWVLPLAVVAAPFVARPHLRRGAWSVLVACAALVFIGKGLHPPLSDVNLWLYEHVPGLFLLREPLSKVGVVLVPLELVGWAFTLDGVVHRWLAKTGRTRLAGIAAVVVLLAGPAVGAWPHLTGEVVHNAGGSDDRVALPQAWNDVARHLNDSSARGKVLVLPLADYYQLPTTWGYYGSDTLVRQLSARPVISLDPQAYIGDSPTFSALVRAVETAVVSGDSDGVESLLRALGVSDVVVRKDIDLHSSVRIPDVEPTAVLEDGLARVPGMVRSFTTSVADVWRQHDAGTSVDPVQALGGLLVSGKVRDDQLVPMLVGTPRELAVVESADGPVASSLVKGQAQSVLAHDDGALVDGSASWDVRRRVGKSALYRATVEPGPTPTVVLRDASAWTIGRVPVPEQPEIRVPLNAGARVIGVRVDGTDRELVDGSALVRLDAQNAIAPVVVDGGRLGAFGELGDCNRFDQRSIDEVGLAVASSGTGDAREVELRAHDHAACVRAPVDVVAGDDVLVEIEARAVDGAAPRVCLWLSGPNTCAVLSGFTEDGSGWSRLHARYTIPAGVEAAALYLYADSPTASGASETITHYRAPHVGVVRALDALDVALPEPPVTRIDLDAGAHAVRNIAAIPPVALGDPSEVGDCNRTDPTTLAQVGITANVSGTSVRLHGDRHSACVHLPVDGMVPGATYRLHLEYRVTEGSAPARACLVGPDGKCTPLGALGVTAEWTDATFDVALPTGAAAGSDVRLYLYADAGTDPETVDYRDIAITPNGDESLTLITADATAAARPTIAWEEDGPARYRVHVENATAPFVVALSDTWSSDWKVRGLPEGGRVEQLRIDGYRNGWAVDAHGSYDLVLEYQPARWGRLALGISIVTMLVLLAGTVAMLGRRVHLRRRYRHVAPLFPNFDR